MRLLKGKQVGENLQITLASQILERTLRKLHSLDNLKIESLKDIACIRAALDVLSTYLGDDVCDNLERFRALPKCLESAKHLCSDSSRFVVQLFFLKQLVRHDPSGLDSVKERCQQKELQWILPSQLKVMQRSSQQCFMHSAKLFYSCLKIQTKNAQVIVFDPV